MEENKTSEPKINFLLEINSTGGGGTFVSSRVSVAKESRDKSSTEKMVVNKTTIDCA